MPTHLLQLQGLPASDLRDILSHTHSLKSSPPTDKPLAAKVVLNLFLEDSTRTRVSFSIAAARLGAHTFDLTDLGSSASKGETVTDTARVVEAHGADAIVIRIKESGGPHLVAEAVSCAVLNAGDGAHEHPTQGLLDVYTIAEHFNLTGTFDFSSLRVAIVGDLLYSRVARSDIAALTTLGATCVAVGPPSLVPNEFATLGCEVSHSLDDVLPTLNAIQMLRVQRERGSSTSGDYIDRFQLNDQRAAAMQPDAIVLHPGPMNRGVEITSSVADGPRSRIFQQVANSIPIRQACLLRALI
ncbi:MAG: aspartate carbamoyltransferase catalytic subunit [Planctomycetota bacterium]|jgi:aspartate carbamoyltransferase catalytic subunit